MCGFAERRSETSEASEQAPSSLYQPEYKIHKSKELHVTYSHLTDLQYLLVILQQQLQSCTNSRSYNHAKIKFMDCILTVTQRYFI